MITSGKIHIYHLLFTIAEAQPLAISYNGKW